MIRKCKGCRKPFKTKPSLVARGQGKFCSKACRDASQLRGVWVPCHVCTEEIWRRPCDFSNARTHTFFCGPSCRSQWNEKVMPAGEQHPLWKGGAKSYRTRALKHYGLKCGNPRCPIPRTLVSKKMLDVDHVDMDRQNNALENLCVLCVWCHAVRTRAAWK